MNNVHNLILVSRSSDSEICFGLLIGTCHQLIGAHCVQELDWGQGNEGEKQTKKDIDFSSSR